MTQTSARALRALFLVDDSAVQRDHAARSPGDEIPLWLKQHAQRLPTPRAPRVGDAPVLRVA